MLGNRRLTARILEQLVAVFVDVVGEEKVTAKVFVAQTNKARWAFDTAEGLVRFRHENVARVHCWMRWSSVGFDVSDMSSRVSLEVSAPTTEQVTDLGRRAEEIIFSAPLEQEVASELVQAKVFLGHGRSSQWQNLRSHLHDLHHVDVRAYETGARGGHTIRDILTDELNLANFAIIVMTAEDDQADGQVRARQNVVHEAGLFQGRLGFSRVAVLVEEGVENFSNLDGLQYIPFSADNIRETYGDVLAMLRREFPEAGFTRNG